VKRILCCFVFLMFLLSAVSAEGPGFDVLPDQYSRLLQLLKAKGIFNNYSHSCELQTDNTGYRYEDHVAYWSDDENSKINNVTVGTLPDSTAQATAVAAMATLSLNAKYNSIPKESPILTKLFRSLQSEIQTKLERTFVSGGSGISTTKSAMLVFQINKNKDMVLVSVVPLTKH
jgi:hypothetical protein